MSSLDNVSWYQASAPGFTGSGPLKSDIRADVCIIGAGFTGLSAALELARAGRKVVVVEARKVAWGASGRNGGLVCTGFSPGMEKFENQLGLETARTCFSIAEEAKDLLKSRIRDLKIECDLKPGNIIAAARPGHISRIEEYAGEFIRYGYDRFEILDKAGLRQKLDSPVYHGGLVDAGAAHIHPLKFARGLARAAIRAGVAIHEDSPVIQVHDGTPARVRTKSATITAGHVISACNAYIAGLLPALHRRVMPVASYILATQPLGEKRARSLIRDNEAVEDSNFVVDYYRLSGDHRMLFGGRASYSGLHPGDLGSYMRPRMLRVFPQLADVSIDYAWGGYIAITYSRLPDAGRLGKSIYYAHGYSGQGVALSGMFGKLVAQAVMAVSDRLDIFAQLKHPPFPGGWLRRPALAAGMLFYRLKDIIG